MLRDPTLGGARGRAVRIERLERHTVAYLRLFARYVAEEGIAGISERRVDGMKNLRIDAMAENALSWWTVKAIDEISGHRNCLRCSGGER